MKYDFHLLDRIPLGAFVVTRDMTVRYWNPCIEDWTGIQSTEITGRKLPDYYPVFLEERYSARLRSVFDQGTPVLLTYRLHGNLFPNRNPSCIERVYHTSVTQMEFDEPAALFMLEDRTEVSSRIKEAREELRRRIETERLLRAALEEKDVLFREIHHRVKNNLNTIVSLIHLQMDSIDDQPTKNHLLDLESRIQSFSLLHETLYRKDVYDSIDVADYLGAVSKQLLESSGRPAVRFGQNLESTRMSVKKALYLGLVLVELVTNALKYGASPDGSTTIHIDLVHADGGTCILRVIDHGRGIGKIQALDTVDSLGIRLIRMMANELGGSVLFETPSGGGTSANFTFSTGSAPTV